MRQTAEAQAPGEPANYIPGLARVSTERFGISVCPMGGADVAAGDAHVPFSLQSITKLFSTALALRTMGDELFRRVGFQPSGSPFNALLRPEFEGTVPRNPFVNAGALVVVDALMSAGLDPVGDLVGALRALVRGGAQDIAVNVAVADSERLTASRTRGLAHLLHSQGLIKNDPESVLTAYFMQCAIELTVVQAAQSASFLACRGSDMRTGREWLTPSQTRRMLGLMFMCGAYQSSVEFSFRIGFPCKSGVGGGIVGVIPGLASVAVWSPGIDEAGNSIRGAGALERLSSKWRLSVLEDRGGALGQAARFGGGPSPWAAPNRVAER